MTASKTPYRWVSLERPFRQPDGYFVDELGRILYWPFKESQGHVLTAALAREVAAAKSRFDTRHVIILLIFVVIGMVAGFAFQAAVTSGLVPLPDFLPTKRWHYLGAGLFLVLITPYLLVKVRTYNRRLEEKLALLVAPVGHSRPAAQRLRPSSQVGKGKMWTVVIICLVISTGTVAFYGLTGLSAYSFSSLAVAAGALLLFGVLPLMLIYGEIAWTKPEDVDVYDAIRLEEERSDTLFVRLGKIYVAMHDGDKKEFWTALQNQDKATVVIAGSLSDQFWQILVHAGWAEKADLPSGYRSEHTKRMSAAWKLTVQGQAALPGLLNGFDLAAKQRQTV